VLIFCLIIPGTSAVTEWLTQGPVPVILIIVVGIVLLGAYINYHLNRVQRDLHELGKGYYEQEKILYDDLKAGRITRSEYRRKHEHLVNSMREDSRKISDGR
jgi:uncharacterized membrane protein